MMRAGRVWGGRDAWGSRRKAEKARSSALLEGAARGVRGPGMRIRRFFEINDLGEKVGFEKLRV
jgi:hypothetical protein